MTKADKYRAAGVDLDASDRAKQRIKEAVTSTHTALTVGGFGAFGGMVRVPGGVEEPVLVMSTDGVGTKVLVAIMAGKHDTVGEDLVNHSVNDILVQGASPIAFLDYIAGATVDEDTIAALVEGVARGCRAHSMALVGGETAQMPDMYHAGHYDLAGTIVGVAPSDAVLLGESVQPGDVLVGYASNGLHTNGYTLARSVIFDSLGLGVDSEIPDLGSTAGEVLLQVHRSYWSSVSPALELIHGLAHITGGGIPGNLNRCLPKGCAAHITRSAWDMPRVFGLLQEAGGVSDAEMLSVFNMGLGLIAAVEPSVVEMVRGVAGSAGVETWAVGEIVEGEGVHIVD